MQIPTTRRETAATESPGVLRILHLEDDTHDIRLIREILGESEISAEMTAVSNRQDFVAALEGGSVDLVLADYRLPSFDGLEALDLTRARYPELPFIFVTGVMGEERAIETLRAGALDYVLKDNLVRLPAAVRRAVAETEDRLRRQQAEEEVARQRLAFQRLAENSPDVILRVDSEFRYIYANPAVGKIAGAGPSDFIGSLIGSQGLGGRQGRVWRKAFEEVFATGELRTVEIDFKGASTATRHWHVLLAPEFGSDGRVETVLAIARDLTATKEAEEALRRANAALAEADRQKDEFLAMLAHELRNPLTPIRFAVTMLRHPGAGEADVQRQADVIDRQVTHMARMLDDLLDVSRITRGKIKLQLMSLDLRDVLDLALDASRPLLLERKLALSYTPPADPLLLDGDPTRLDQVVRNVIGNAVKFSNEGGTIRVSLDWERRDGAPFGIVRVEDSGIGIAPEMLPRIFDLFVQGEQTLDRARGGLGIGLTVVKRLVEMHGGTVLAESAGPGHGTAVTVTLRLSVDPSATVPDDGAGTDEQALAPSAVALKHLSVLVVEDNIDAALSLAELLRVWEQEPMVVHNGADAVRLAEAARFDVVLMDLGLPDMNGFEVARHLREGSRNTGAFLVAVTGYGQEEYRVRAARAGFDHHLTKPVDPSVLRDLLLAASAGRRVGSS